jgi:hypothetical protein
VKELPNSLKSELAELRDRNLRKVAKDIAAYNSELDKLYAGLPEKIQKAAKGKKPRKTIRRMITAFFRAAAAPLLSITKKSIGETDISKEYDNKLLSHGIRKRKQLLQNWKQLPHPRRVYPIKKTWSGDPLARRHLTPWSKIKRPTKLIRDGAESSAREATRIVTRSIKDAESVGSSARSLQTYLGKARKPRIIRDFEKAGERLARSSGEIREWAALKKRMRKYYSKLRIGSTTQSAYIELLQDIEKWGPAQVDKAVEKWTYWKQRYNAERIIRTETATAYRQRQVASDKARPWIIGYRWVLNRGLHRKFVARKPGKLKKFGGRHWVDTHIVAAHFSLYTTRKQ